MTTHTTLRGDADTEQDRVRDTTGIVPARMTHVADGRHVDDVRLEIYLDRQRGDGCIITTTEELIGTLVHSGTVLLHVTWAGTALERGDSWCGQVRYWAAGVIAGDDQ